MIKAENPHASWLMIMAFRYAVGRHGTRALRDITPTIQENINILHDCFIQQMIEDIEFEQKTYKGENTDYLTPFKKWLIEEYKRRRENLCK